MAIAVSLVAKFYIQGRGGPIHTASLSAARGGASSAERLPREQPTRGSILDRSGDDPTGPLDVLLRDLETAGVNLSTAGMSDDECDVVVDGDATPVVDDATPVADGDATPVAGAPRSPGLMHPSRDP